MKPIWITFALLWLAAILGSSLAQCDVGDFQCDSGQCIPGSWVCDRKKDCDDGSDETLANCTCRFAEFKCANGECIRGIYICDDYDDCGDMSDERNPETGECPPCPDPDYHFTCDNGKCMTPGRLCDGFDDCGDLSDEFTDPDKCPACSDSQFRCENGRCVRKEYQCDDENDCGDWSDESDETCPCGDNLYRCPSPPSDVPVPPAGCIPPEYICDEDGIWDCPTGADEANCSLIARKYDQF